VSSTAFLRFKADSLEGHSFSRVKPQWKGAHMEVGDPRGQSSLAAVKKTKKSLLGDHQENKSKQ
jgi:hypothetical protein